MSGTIYENILLGIPSSPFSSCESCSSKAKVELEARVHSACRAARIDDFIVSLPEGYETAVGAKGLALSGVGSTVSVIITVPCQPIPYQILHITCLSPP